MDSAMDRILSFNRLAAGTFLRLSDGRGFGAFFGPSAAGMRAEVLSALWGHPVSKSRAPWGVFVRELREAFGAHGDCEAMRESDCEARILATYNRDGVTP